MQLDELAALRWATGKDAVDAVKNVALLQEKHARVGVKGGTFRRLICESAATGCAWSMCLSCQRSKADPGQWHVTDGSIQHQNCMGPSKPTSAQLESNTVVWATISTDPSTFSRDLVTRLRVSAG